MSKRLKIGLVGAGVFAGYHANKLSALPRIQFTGIYDPEVARAETLAAKHNVEALSLYDLISGSEALIIASPASSHFLMSEPALLAGCHLLIEKPMTTTAAEAQILIDLAYEHRCVLQVGHQERQVLRAIGLDQLTETPQRVAAIRNATPSVRGTDTSVTLDLMSHDIDLCTMLFGGRPISISADVEGDPIDIARAVLKYESGTAELTASRVAEAGQRTMTIAYASGEVVIDFNAKTLTNTTGYDLNANFANQPQAADSLGAATQDFIASILDRADISVTGTDGLIAVEVCEAIDQGNSQ